MFVVLCKFCCIRKIISSRDLIFYTLLLLSNHNTSHANHLGLSGSHSLLLCLLFFLQKLLTYMKPHRLGLLSKLEVLLNSVQNFLFYFCCYLRVYIPILDYMNVHVCNLDFFISSFDIPSLLFFFSFFSCLVKIIDSYHYFLIF